MLMYNFHRFTLPFKTMHTISNSIDTMSAQTLHEIRIESAYQMTKLLFFIDAYFTIYHTLKMSLRMRNAVGISRELSLNSNNCCNAPRCM